MTKYHSGFEELIAAQLEAAGVKFKYEDKAYNYFLPVYQSVCKECGSKDVQKKHRYTPDFFLENGVVLEVKGYFKTKDRKILKAMREQHPEIDLRAVFLYDNKLNKKSETRYSDWCKQNDIQYAIKKVPPEWI